MAHQDLKIVKSVSTGDAAAWSTFVQHTADTVFTVCTLTFEEDLAEREALHLFERLKEDNFAPLRPYDGRSALTTYLTLNLQICCPNGSCRFSPKISDAPG